MRCGRIRPVAARRVALACVFAVACGREAPAPAEAVAIAVTVQPARFETLRDTLSLPGTVVASALAEFTVFAIEPAEIVELPKAEGDAVTEGDVLVRFEMPSLTTNMRARQSEVNDAEQRVESARAEVKRLTAVYDQGIVPRNMVEAARAALATAEIQLNQAKASLEASKVLSDRAVVRARFSGIVAMVWHKVGDRVTADSADPILRVIDPTRTQVLMQVPVAQIDRLAPGFAGTVSTAEGVAVAASVSSRSAPAGPSATTGDVRLSFLGPSPFKIDTPVQVEMLLDERRDVVVAPAQAIVREGSTSILWIARPDGRAERREVRVGLTSRGLAQVLTGLAVNELIITAGIAQLQDGVAITVSR